MTLSGNASKLREMPAMIVLGVALVWLFATKGAFRAPTNLIQDANDIGLRGVLACGEAMVILTGEIDLSVGAVAALAACVAGSQIAKGVSWPLAAAMGLLAAAAAGWVNGALITYRKLPPILTTLATWFILRALVNIVSNATPYNDLPESFKAVGRGMGPFLILIFVTALLAWLLARSRFGRRVVAVGGGEQAARLSGIPTEAVTRGVYVVCGICAGLAGLLIAAGSNHAQWNLAEDWELDVVAAVVIGGVRLTGGEGSVIGAALGAVIIVLLQNGLQLSGVPKAQHGVITGLVILIAALAEQFRRVRSAKSTPELQMPAPPSATSSPSGLKAGNA